LNPRQKFVYRSQRSAISSDESRLPSRPFVRFIFDTHSKPWRDRLKPDQVIEYLKRPDKFGAQIAVAHPFTAPI
jgi:hypothetical protein